MNKEQEYFPCTIYDNGSHHTIRIVSDSATILDKYGEMFEKYGYSGNGYTWEGHLIQILEKEQPELLEHIDFDPEAGGFFAYADTRENQVKFAELINRTCSDLNLFEQYIKADDRDRVDD